MCCVRYIEFLTYFAWVLSLLAQGKTETAKIVLRYLCWRSTQLQLPHTSAGGGSGADNVWGQSAKVGRSVCVRICAVSCPIAGLLTMVCGGLGW